MTAGEAAAKRFRDCCCCRDPENEGDEEAEKGAVSSDFKTQTRRKEENAGRIHDIQRCRSDGTGNGHGMDKKEDDSQDEMRRHTRQNRPCCRDPEEHQEDSSKQGGPY